MGLGSGIRKKTYSRSRIPNPGVKKAPDPGSGSATLSTRVACTFLRQLLTDDTIIIYLVCTCPPQNKYFAHTNRDGFFFDASRNVLYFMHLPASEQIFCTHKSGRIFLRRFDILNLHFRVPSRCTLDDSLRFNLNAAPDFLHYAAL
jgi:hypothetical protein